MLDFQEYELYNTETDEIESYQMLQVDEVVTRNTALIANGEPQRWVSARTLELVPAPGEWWEEYGWPC